MGEIEILSIPWTKRQVIFTAPDDAAALAFAADYGTVWYDPELKRYILQVTAQREFRQIRTILREQAELRRVSPAPQ